MTGPLLYGNQSIDLQSKSMDWFLYNNDLHHERVKDSLKKDNSFTVHHRNIQSFAIELFKVKENLFNTIMNDILQTRTLIYKLRLQEDFTKSFVNTTLCGLINTG